MNPCLILLHLLGIPLRGSAIKRLNFKLYLSNLFEKRGLLGGNRLSRIRCGLGIPRSRLLPLDPPVLAAPFPLFGRFVHHVSPHVSCSLRGLLLHVCRASRRMRSRAVACRNPLSLLLLDGRSSTSPSKCLPIFFFSKNNIPPRILRLSYSRIFSRNSFSNHESILSFPEINSGARVEYSAEQYFWKRRNFDERSLRME